MLNKILIIAAIIMFEYNINWAQDNYLIGDIKPGPFKVGVKIFHEKDYSRNFSVNTDPNTNKIIKEFVPYPMQIVVWYPAEGNSGKLLKFGDYVDLNITRDGLEYKNDKRAKAISDSLYFRNSFMGTVDTSKLLSFLNLKTTAYLDAKEMTGKFPVIIYSSTVSDGSYNNSVMNEYLASNGYIVITSTPNFPTALSFYENITSGMRYLKSFAHKFPNTDMSKVGAIGYQNIAAAGFAAADYSISAYVDLTAQIASQNNFVNQVRQNYNYLNSSSLRVPLLLIDGTNNQLQKNNIQNEYDQMLYTDVYHINFEKAIPLSFSSEWIIRWIRGMANMRQGFFVEKEFSEKAYESTVLFTKKFLDAYVKGDKNSIIELKSNIGNERYTISHRDAATIPPTPAQFQAIIQNNGVDEGLKIWKKVKDVDPSYHIMPNSFFFNSWGYQLISQGKTKEAVILFEMMLEDFPNDPNLWDSAGEGYFADGQKRKAAEAFKKSLTWDPPPPKTTIDNSVSLLRQLGYKVDNEGKNISQNSSEDMLNLRNHIQPIGKRKADSKYNGVQLFDDPARVSPNREISASLGDLFIKIEYGAPSIRNRKLLERLIPTYRVWRTGANEATVLTFTKPVKLEGNFIPAGSYALFTIGGKEEWTIVLNSEYQQWGAFTYNANNDLLRFKVKSKKGNYQEEMKFEITNQKSGSGTIILEWGDIEVPIKFETAD